MRKLLVLFLTFAVWSAAAQKPLSSSELQIGVLPKGKLNAITDVAGVKVGHTTLISGNDVRTGVTAILPHAGNLFLEKVPAAIYAGNGFGKLSGSTQVKELGNLESPIILTNTLAVGVAMQAVVNYTLAQPGNEKVRSVNAVVGETNDSFLNNIRKQPVQSEHVLSAITNATAGPVAEGNVGAGTGTMCFGFKGGIGSASRRLPASLGGYTVGVLVQTNFGGVLQIAGAPVGRELKTFDFSDKLLNNADGSCMIVVATDAPLDSRNLERLARRAFLGMGKTGGIASNGSGDYIIAFSTAAALRIPYNPATPLAEARTLHNDYVSPIFMAAIEATEEAIIRSLFAARDMEGVDGHQARSLPAAEVRTILKKYNQLNK